MEDVVNAVFTKRDQQILYKQILDNNLLKDLKNCINSKKFKDNTTRLSSRYIMNDDMDNDILNELKKTIKIVLSNYFIFDIGGIRIYKQEFGEIKPHIDVSSDGKSTYTLLIYMTDNFEGGELHLKCKRTDEEKGSEEPEKHHYLYTIKPKAGYGIVFNKNILHWSPEIYGTKEIILIDLII